MMFRFMKWLSRAYLQRPVLYLENAASTWLNSHDDLTIVTSPRAYAAIAPQLDHGGKRIILDPPIEVADLEKIVPSIKTVWVVGIGAGRVMDASKYLAMRSRRKLCLIPSALSTTSWLNMAIAIRKDGILHFPGTIHARRTIIDPIFISKAPVTLTIGGLVDILAACTAVTDWVISHDRTGEKISHQGVNAFQTLIARILDNPGQFLGDQKKIVRVVYDTFLEALALCGASFSGRPVEGSEHFLYYFAEELVKRRFTHGEVIAFMMLASLHLQGTRAIVNPSRLRTFLDKIGVSLNPADVDLSRVEMKRVLSGARSFVEARKLPFSVLNELNLDTNSSLLDPILDALFS